MKVFESLRKNSVHSGAQFRRKGARRLQVLAVTAMLAGLLNGTSLVPQNVSASQASDAGQKASVTATPASGATGGVAGEGAASSASESAAEGSQAAPYAVQAVSFSDVYFSDNYYAGVLALANRSPQVLGGYSDGTFRPYNDATRGAIAKIIVNAMSWPYNTSGGPHFADVPTWNEFYNVVETAFNRGVMGGYPCGGTGEPCDSLNRPYFRPGQYATRGQFTKMFANAMGWGWVQAPTPSFGDVPTNDTFYGYIEAAYGQGAVSFYNSGCTGGNTSCRTFSTYSNIKRGDLTQIIHRGQGTGYLTASSPMTTVWFGDSGTGFYNWDLYSGQTLWYSTYYDASYGNLATPKKIGHWMRAQNVGYKSLRRLYPCEHGRYGKRLRTGEPHLRRTCLAAGWTFLYLMLLR